MNKSWFYPVHRNAGRRWLEQVYSAVPEIKYVSVDDYLPEVNRIVSVRLDNGSTVTGFRVDYFGGCGNVWVVYTPGSYHWSDLDGFKAVSWAYLPGNSRFADKPSVIETRKRHVLIEQGD